MLDKVPRSALKLRYKSQHDLEFQEITTGLLSVCMIIEIKRKKKNKSSSDKHLQDYFVVNTSYLCSLMDFFPSMKPVLAEENLDKKYLTTK